MKIVSLVPSLTESLFDFGTDNFEVAGRTKFCIHPEDQIAKIPVIGGTKKINTDKIRQLSPDLIIANKEENEKIQIEELEKDFDVWITDIHNLEDNRQFLRKLGSSLNKSSLAEDYIEKIDAALPVVSETIKTAYLIWQKPYMTVGSDTFIHDVMKKCGFENIFGNHLRYPEIRLEDLENAELLLLSTEPYPFHQKHIEDFKKIFPEKKIMFADGEAFSWYGTHLSRRRKYFEEIKQNVYG